MSETKFDLSEAPAWLDLPHKAEYWVCTGEFTSKAKRTIGKRQTVVFYSAEDAEAHAARPNQYWTWDRLPASQVSLRECMRDARVFGLAGVVVLSYRGGEWVAVHEYPADQPLPPDLLS